MTGATAAGWLATASAGGFATLLAGLAAWWRDGFHVFLAGAEAYTPALLLGLGWVVAVPVLALVGFGLRRLAARSTAKSGSAEDDHGPITARIIGRACPRLEAAWLEMEGRPAWRFAIDHELVRIGRENDNDIRLEGRGVHRYHAALQRSADAEFAITDLSSTDGSGIAVNGRRLDRASLVDGDRIELAGTVLLVRIRPVLDVGDGTSNVADFGAAVAERTAT